MRVKSVHHNLAELLAVSSRREQQCRFTTDSTGRGDLLYTLRLRTWDRKAVPLPFSRIELDYGAPIQVAEVSDEALQAFTAALSRD